MSILTLSVCIVIMICGAIAAPLAPQAIPVVPNTCTSFTTVYGLGANSKGTLGDGTTTSTSRLARTRINGTVLELAGGFSITAARTATTLYTWGDNLGGILGDLDPNPDVIDLTVAPLQSKIIKQIKCGSSHCVVLSTDNSIAAWGLNLNGQLGDGTTTTNKAPVAVVAGSIAGAALNRIEAGGSFSLAVTSAGYIHAWGANARNQLGNGGTADSSSPTAVDMTVLDNRSLKKISSGNTFTYVLTQDSKIIGWGSINANNKINTTPKLVDLATLGGRSPADISSGHGHLLVLNSDGTLYGTGTQTLTKAINGTTIDSYNAFVLLRGVASELLGSETILTISGGYSASYATTNYGRILAWGSNSSYQLGMVPQYVNSGAATVAVAIDLGVQPGNILAPVIADKGQDFKIFGVCNGTTNVPVNMAYNAQPQKPNPHKCKTVTKLTNLGNDDNYYYKGPNPAQYFVDYYYLGRTIVPIRGLTYGTKGSYVAHYDDSGDFGPDLSGITSDRTFVELTGGGQVTVVRAPSGNLYAWGDNTFKHPPNWGAKVTGGGTLGVGHTGGVFKATQVLNNEASALFQKTVISIKCGAYHCIALNSDNSVAGWGRNDYGQVGVDYRYTAYYSDDNFYNMPPEPYQSFQHTPQLINRGKIGQKEIVLIECGSMASYAVTRDGTIYDWGLNSEYQLGTGNTNANAILVSFTVGNSVTQTYNVNPSPADMTNLYKKSITKIVGEASNKHSMAVLTTDGTVLAWGRMIYDQYTKAIPTPFPAIPNKLVVDIAIVPRTYITTVFLTSDGLVYTRGEHNSGNDDAYIQETKIVPQMLIGERVVEVAGSGYGAIYASTNYGRILGWSSTYVTTLAKDSIRGSLGWRFGPNRPIVVLNEKDLQLNSTLAPMIAQKGYGSNEGSVWINGPSGSFGGFVTFGSCTGTLHDPMLQDIRALPWTSQVDHMIRLGYTTVAPGSNKRDVVYAGGSVQASNQCLQSSQIYGVGTNQQYQMLRGVETPTRNYFLTVTKANMANLGGGTQTLAELRGGTGFVVARTTSGALYAWGSTTFNTLANGMTTPAQGMVVTAQKIPISAQVSQVVCGDVHCIALTSTAALFSWGSNVYGQLGIGSVGGNSGVSAVTRGALGTKRVVQIAAGHIASYAITEDGYIYAWGGNTNRQLANSDLPTTGTASMQSSPATIKYYHKLLFFDSIIGESPVKMGSGAISTYVMMASGQIYSWGTATTSNIEIFRIDQTALGGRFIVDISVGAYQCLAMTSDGEMFATGTNNLHLLGDGGIANYLTSFVRSTAALAALHGGETVTKVIAMTTNSAMLTTEGRLIIWGKNNYGQLGIGTTVDPPTGNLKTNQLNLASVTGFATGPNSLAPLVAEGTSGFVVFASCSGTYSATTDPPPTTTTTKPPTPAPTPSSAPTTTAEPIIVTEIVSFTPEPTPTPEPTSTTPAPTPFSTPDPSATPGPTTPEPTTTQPPPPPVQIFAVMNTGSTIVVVGKGLTQAVGGIFVKITKGPDVTYVNATVTSDSSAEVSAGIPLANSVVSISDTPDFSNKLIETSFISSQPELQAAPAVNTPVVPSCFGTLSTDSTVCSGRGVCISTDICKCGTLAVGAQCEQTTCSGVASTDPTVCSGHGNCTLPDVCDCNTGYYGAKCSSTICYTLQMDDPSVCSGNGQCTAPNTCTCRIGWSGTKCEVPVCFDVPANNANTCWKRGSCTAPDTCTCRAPYSQSYMCKSPMMSISSVTPDTVVNGGSITVTGAGFIQTDGKISCDYVSTSGQSLGTVDAVVSSSTSLKCPVQLNANTHETIKVNIVRKGAAIDDSDPSVNPGSFSLINSGLTGAQCSADVPGAQGCPTTTPTSDGSGNVVVASALEGRKGLKSPNTYNIYNMQGYQDFNIKSVTATSGSPIEFWFFKDGQLSTYTTLDIGNKLSLYYGGVGNPKYTRAQAPCPFKLNQNYRLVLKISYEISSWVVNSTLYELPAYKQACSVIYLPLTFDPTSFFTKNYSTIASQAGAQSESGEVSVASAGGTVNIELGNQVIECQPYKCTTAAQSAPVLPAAAEFPWTTIVIPAIVVIVVLVLVIAGLILAAIIYFSCRKSVYVNAEVEKPATIDDELDDFNAADEKGLEFDSAVFKPAHNSVAQKMYQGYRAEAKK